MTRPIYIAVLALLIIGSFTTPVFGEEKEDIVLIFDEGHRQFFDYNLIKTAFAGLNDSLDLGNVDRTVYIILNPDGFNSSNLQGADLLVVTNPGINKGSTTQFNIPESETEAVDVFVDNGGSVFYMGNPFTYNWTIAGHKAPMDNLVARGFDATFKQGAANDNDNTTIIIDEFYNDGNSTNIFLDQTNIDDTILFSEGKNVSRILYYGSSISQTLAEDITGTADNAAYSIDQRASPLGDEIGAPIWLTAKDFGEDKGRTLMIGSTIMFSDLPYDDSTKWIDQEDNLLFFENIVTWLLKISPLNVPSPVVTNSISQFVTANLFAAILVSGTFVVLTFVILIKRGNVSFTDVFKFRIGKRRAPKGKKKGDTVQKEPAKPSKKKAKKQRRKRT